MSRPTVLVRIALAAAFTLTACDFRGTFDHLRPAPSTPYERYAEGLRDAGLDSTALGQEWLAASDSALRAPLAAVLPLRETGIYMRDEARAVAYRMHVRDGERVHATLRADGLAARLYLDLFEVTGDSASPFHHRATADTVVRRDSAAAMLDLAWEARRDGDVVLRLQPELLRAGTFTLVVRTEPVLAFPVKGGSNGSIQSYYGAERDGGARDHQGIDIFAPRGTPVLAATDGVVRSTAPNQLGGDVVWLSDEQRGQSLYYAHLDRHIVREGQRVRVGDTLGFVGNTGNARTTPPHLHFGIYRRGQGAVNPLYHVRQTVDAPNRDVLDVAVLGRRAVVRVAGAELRSGAQTGATVVARLEKDAGWSLMAANGSWYRVQAPDGRTGYLRPGNVVVASGAPVTPAARRGTQAIRTQRTAGSRAIGARSPAGRTKFHA